MRLRKGVLILAFLLGVACGRPTSVTGVATPTPSAVPTAAATTATPEPSPASSETPNAWSSFADPQGRFSFDYPAGWHIESRAEGRQFYPVSFFSFDPDQNSGSMAGKSSLDVILFKDESEVGPLARPTPTTAARGPAEYEIWRRGEPDPYDRHGRDLEFVATARFVRRNIVFHVQIATGSRPPDKAFEIFRHVLDSFVIE